MAVGNSQLFVEVVGGVWWVFGLVSKPIEVSGRTHTCRSLMRPTTPQTFAQECAVQRGKIFQQKGTVPFGLHNGLEPVKLVER